MYSDAQDSYSGERFYIGPPGTGKTSALIAQVHAILERFGKSERDYDDVGGSHNERCSAPVSVCSLTRAAAIEIATKKHPATGRGVNLPRHQVGTLHSMAYSEIGRPPLAEANAGEWNRRYPALAITPGADEENTDEDIAYHAGAAPGDHLYSRYNLLRAREVPRALWPESVRAFARKWETWRDKNGYVDFTGMIERAIEEVPTAPGNPKVILYDEAQDGSALEHRLIRKWGRAAGGMIMAGDPWQAIYTWRGANPAMFSDPTIPPERFKVLAQSYRIPRAVHAAAMRWIKRLSDYREIVYRPRDADGIAALMRATWKQPGRAVDYAERAVFERGKSAMIMGSCSYMLAPTLAVLRARALPFSNPWRKTRGDWNPLAERKNALTMKARILEFLRADPLTYPEIERSTEPNLLLRRPPPWTPKAFRAWAELLAANGNLVRGAKERMNTDDPMECLTLLEDDALDDLNAVVTWAETVRDISGTAEMIRWLRARVMASKRSAFDYPAAIAERRGGRVLAADPRIHVGTIHSFKGAEADVVIVFPDLSVEGARAWGMAGARRDAVVRAFYVALTRAREEVWICMPASAALAVDLECIVRQ